MMKFLKFFFAIIALGCAVELSAYIMGRGVALIIVSVIALIIGSLYAIVYSRDRARQSLTSASIDLPLELSIKPYSPPIMLKTNTSSSGGSGSSVAPMNRVNTTPQNAPKQAMRSSMM